MRYRGHAVIGCQSLAWVMLVFLGACGGSSPSSPTPTPTPTPAPPPDWIVNGRVIEYGTGAPVAGAKVDAGVAVGTFQTDAAGAFQIKKSSLPSVLRVQIDATGFITRETNLHAESGTRNVTIDIVRDHAPFSLSFYRELARNAYESTTLETLSRLSANPKFYVRVVDQNGKAVEPEVLDLVTTTIPRAVADWSAGTLHVAALETGSATRDRTPGWVVVNIQRDSHSEACGDALVGVESGRIRLWDDVCSCGSIKISAEVVAHEVGHAMGFWHVRDSHALMFPTVLGCPRGVLTEAEKYHAALAYSRARGNEDEDSDPADATPLHVSGEPVLIVN